MKQAHGRLLSALMPDDADGPGAPNDRFGWRTRVIVVLASTVAGAFIGYNVRSDVGPIHLPPLPTLKEFTVSAGFGGTAALVAAIIAASAAIYSVNRTAKSHKDQLEQQDRHFSTTHATERITRRQDETAQAVMRCWDRLVWLVESASTRPAAADAASSSLNLGPELAYDLLQTLEADARGLEDSTLEKAVNSYVTQFGLVLTKQVGKHSRPADSQSTEQN